MKRMRSGVDEKWMLRALALALKADGQTSPNPLVGAVIVKGGRLLGEGYHRYAGAAHAEAVALKRAGDRARGAVLYCTLEPCAHQGRTPPCADALIQSGIRKVVIAMSDPDPRVSGKGIRRLRSAGIDVEIGLCRSRAEAINRPYLKVQKVGMPFVIAKVGQSLDGKIATASGESRWITGDRAREQVQRLRRSVDAIMVGVNTVVRDDPQLTFRGLESKPKPLVRIIVDSHLRVPIKARCLRHSESPTWIATLEQDSRKAKQLRRMGVMVLTLPRRQGRPSLKALMRRLAGAEIHRLLVEGGGELLGSVFAEGLVDRVRWYIAPRLIGGRSAVPSVGGEGFSSLRKAARLTNWTVTPVGGDLCIEADVAYP